MPIHVVCPGCKKRFTVSEKFAGQQGPCPNCKTILSIPKNEDEIVIHGPEEALPKDSKGHSVVQPILREESNFSLPWTLAIVGTVVAAFVGALLLRGVAPSMPWVIGGLGAVLLGPPLVWAGYSFLQNAELQPYRGKELWIRVAACSVAYAAIWGAYVWAGWVLEVKSYEIWQIAVIGTLAVLAGGFAAFTSLDLDFLVGVMHYGLYLIVTALLGYLAHLQVL